MTARARRILGRFRPAARRFAADERGVTAMEYGLIAACVALAFISIAILLGDDVGAMFEDLSSSVQDIAVGGGE